MPKRKRKYTLSDYVVWGCIIILISWAVKVVLKLDPAEELTAIPWMAVAFGAGGLYTKVANMATDLKEMTKDLIDIRDTLLNHGERLAKLEAKTNKL